MRHVALTCKNHPELRWQCKSIAFTPGYGYNGARHIFYNGAVLASKPHPDAPDPPECTCPSTDLVLAPEEVWDESCKE